MTTTPESDAPDQRRVILSLALLAVLIVGIPLMIWLASANSSASFSDAEVMNDNRLGASTLDIEVGSAEAVFDARNLAPGDTVSGHLDVANVGTLPLTLSVSATSSDGVLADWLLFSVWTVEGSCLPDDLATDRGQPLAVDLRISGSGTGSLGSGEPIRLAPGEGLVLCLGAALPLEAGNEVQGQQLGVNLVLDAVHDLEATES